MSFHFSKVTRLARKTVYTRSAPPERGILYFAARVRTTRFSAQAGSLWKSENSSFFLPRDHKTCCLFMGLLGLYMGKVTRVQQKLVGSAVFLKLVRPLVFSDPAGAENRVYYRGSSSKAPGSGFFFMLAPSQTQVLTSQHRFFFYQVVQKSTSTGTFHLVLSPTWYLKPDTFFKYLVL